MSEAQPNASSATGTVVPVRVLGIVDKDVKTLALVALVQALLADPDSLGALVKGLAQAIAADPDSLAVLGDALTGAHPVLAQLAQAAPQTQQEAQTTPRDLKLETQIDWDTIIPGSSQNQGKNFNVGLKPSQLRDAIIAAVERAMLAKSAASVSNALNLAAQHLTAEQAANADAATTDAASAAPASA